MIALEEQSNIFKYVDEPQKESNVPSAPIETSLTPLLAI